MTGPSVRSTRQRAAISTLLETVDDFRSAQELHDELRRRCSEHHHHHLVCRSCGSTIEVADHEVEAWAAEVAARHGFSDVSHTIEIFGNCADCRS